MHRRCRCGFGFVLFDLVDQKGDGFMRELIDLLSDRADGDDRLREMLELSKPTSR